MLVVYRSCVRGPAIRPLGRTLPFAFRGKNRIEPLEFPGATSATTMQCAVGQPGSATTRDPTSRCPRGAGYTTPCDPLHPASSAAATPALKTYRGKRMLFIFSPFACIAGCRHARPPVKGTAKGDSGPYPLGTRHPPCARPLLPPPRMPPLGRLSRRAVEGPVAGAPPAPVAVIVSCVTRVQEV